MTTRNLTVTLPFAGHFVVALDDFEGTDEEAYEAAVDRLYDTKSDPRVPDSDTLLDWEYEIHRKLVQGNVMSFWINEYEVEEES